MAGEPRHSLVGLDQEQSFALYSTLYSKDFVLYCNKYFVLYYLYLQYK